MDNLSNLKKMIFLTICLGIVAGGIAPRVWRWVEIFFLLPNGSTEVMTVAGIIVAGAIVGLVSFRKLSPKN